MMTTTNNQYQQQQVKRMAELGRIAKERYLNAGGNPRLSVGSLNDNDTLTKEEKQEFLKLANEIFDDESIANFLKKRGTWQERFAAIKQSKKISE